MEAKREDLTGGIPRCLAEMFAAQVFNERRGLEIPVVYGTVTSGTVWKFLRLSGSLAEVDLTEFYLSDIDRIFGVLVHMVSGPSPAARTI